jgi:hypothetical protein
MSNSTLRSSESHDDSKESLLGLYGAKEYSSGWESKPKRKSHIAVIIPWLISFALIAFMVLQRIQINSTNCEQECFWKPHELGKFKPLLSRI